MERINPDLHRAYWVQVLLVVWRWLPEIYVAIGLLVALTALTNHGLPVWAAGSLLAGFVGVLMLAPFTRTVICRLFWMEVTRHRLRSFMVENTIMSNRSGRHPWLLVIRPTPVGERAWMVVPAGVSVLDIEKERDSLGSTCYATDGTVVVHKKWAHLVRIDIKRRDVLGKVDKINSVLVSDAERRTDMVLPASITTGGVHEPSAWGREVIGVPVPRSENDTSHKAGKNGKAKKPAASDPAAASAEPETVGGVSRAARPTKTKGVNDRDPNVALSIHGEDISDYV